MAYRKLLVRVSQAALIVFLSVAGSSWAQTQNLQVTTHVKESCTITLPVDLTFGDYNPLSGTALTTNGSVTLTCTKGSNGVTLGVGTGLHSAGSQRNMLGTVGAENLAYNLFQPDVVGATGVTTGTAFDGTSTAPGAFAVPAAAFATGSTAVLVKIFGSIPINQDVTGQSGAGNAFTDTVVATVYF